MARNRKFKIELEVEHNETESGFVIDGYQRQLVLQHLMEDVTNQVFLPGGIITGMSMVEVTDAVPA